MERDDEQAEKATKKILGAAHAVKYEGPANLENRVLYTLLRERESKPRFSLTAWFNVGLATACSILIGFFVIQNASNKSFSVAGLDRPLLIRVEIPTEQDLSKSEATFFAMVELPEGMEFYSGRFPEIRNQRSLRVDLASLSEKDFPVLVKGTSLGKREVTVRFFDQSQRQIAVQKVKLWFQEA